MAISKGHLAFTGRRGNVLHYYVGNEIYVRTVFDGQRKRVMKDKRYELFRLYGSFFSKSSKIGSFIYGALGLKNEKKLYNKIVGEAQKFFKHTNMNGEQVMEVMVEKYMNGFEVEVPKENEENGKTWGLLLAKREKEKKEREEIINNQIVLEEGCWVNEDGEMFGMKEEIKTQEMTGILAKVEDQVEYEHIPKCSAKDVMTSKPVTRKKSRILKASVKVRWKGNDVSSERMNNEYGEESENCKASFDGTISLSV